LKIHIVQKGDTLWELSKKYGVDFEELKQMNSHLSSPDMIMPGMKIRIPSSAKAVKKEAPMKEAPIKEAPMVEQPYKDITPKPMPVIKEDDKKPVMDVKPEMPMPQMPQMIMPQVMQAPTTEQELTYMSFSFPEVHITEESSTDESSHHKEKPKKKPMYQPMHQPVHMVPCFPVHPCCGPHMPMMHHPCMMHHHHHPHMLPQQMMGYPGAMMPVQDTEDDCGCGGGKHETQMPQMGYMPQGGFEPMMNPQMPQGYYEPEMNAQMPQGYYEPTMNTQDQPFQMQPTTTYPSMSPYPTNSFPTPPGYGELRTNDKEESSD
jgi:morphogenetic protein associated with SpoVID